MDAMKYDPLRPPGAKRRRLAVRARVFVAGATLLLLGTSACHTVEFYEMEAFTDPVMALGDDASEVHLHQKVFYSMEGSAGGIGSSAGGGCGCY